MNVCTAFPKATTFENQEVKICFASIALDGQLLKSEITYDATYHSLVGTEKEFDNSEGLLGCKSHDESITFVREVDLAKDAVAMVLMNLGRRAAIPFCNLFLSKKADAVEIEKRVLWASRQMRTCRSCISEWINNKDKPVCYPNEAICFVSNCRCDSRGKSQFCVCACDRCFGINCRCEFILPLSCITDGETTQASVLTKFLNIQNNSFEKISSGNHTRDDTICGLYDIGHLLKSLRNPLKNEVIIFMGALISVLMFFCLQNETISPAVVLNVDKMSEGI